MIIAAALKGDKVKRLTFDVISKVSANRYIVHDEKTPAILDFNSSGLDKLTVHLSFNFLFL